jgi:hypothetical protein
MSGAWTTAPAVCLFDVTQDSLAIHGDASTV